MRRCEGAHAHHTHTHTKLDDGTDYKERSYCCCPPPKVSRAPPHGISHPTPPALLPSLPPPRLALTNLLESLRLDVVVHVRGRGALVSEGGDRAVGGV